jgi:molybdate transport system ATP-binding protein
VTATLDRCDGPVTLLGHSYGGAPITVAGIHPAVERLVYLTAMAPDDGQNATGTDVQIGDATLVTAEPHEGEVLLTVAPSAVSLHRHQPESSARNRWPATVDHTEPLGGRVRVHLTGAIPLTAEVTPAAVRELDLRDGADTWVAVKATEVSVYPA